MEILPLPPPTHVKMVLPARWLLPPLMCPLNHQPLLETLTPAKALLKPTALPMLQELHTPGLSQPAGRKQQEEQLIQ